MSMKNNFGRAMYDVFGVGKDPTEDEEVSAGETDAEEFDAGEPQSVAPEEPAQMFSVRGGGVPDPEQPIRDLRVEKAVEVHTYEGTYLAAGTMMQGTLTARGDVEIAGDFEGEIIAKGTVTLHSSISSKITAMGLILVGCTLTGDVEVSGNVSLDDQSMITGNVKAESMTCSGKVKGDLDIQDSLVLDGFAQIDGNIKVDTMSMARGAKIAGSIEMHNLRK